VVNYHIDDYKYSRKPMINQTLSINNLPDLLTVREVAQILRVSPLTIKRWGKRGKLRQSGLIPEETEVQKRSRTLALRNPIKRRIEVASLQFLIFNY